MKLGFYIKQSNIKCKKIDKFYLNVFQIVRISFLF